MPNQENVRLREILEQASELPPEQRVAFLDQACSGDPALRQEVESLLLLLEKANGFLEEPTIAPDDLSSWLVQADGTRTGPSRERIGPYKLLQLIGEGGFGSVFMAEQQTPVVRKVALKIIKPGMDSAAIIARFEAERQALAMMDHPNIARVLDAGTTEAGRPFFVMELVQGIPINKYCDRKRLLPRQRIELFIPVCRAVQHAHQKGVIHRDLKPSNILVMICDGQPVPKVIDFGVAKALDQRLTEKTLFTQFGHAVGTPEYMSPEQAEMDVFGADTRSDIYSLGALLYELLTGVTPLDRAKLREAGYAQMLRMIREVEPLRPSTRLTQSGDALASISVTRGTEPGELTRLIAGDLDWIVMRCLEKDRARRYESADGLARDLERYLHDEPVEATPPSIAYKVRKLIKRHKKEAMAILAVMAALVLGITGTSIGLARARHHLAAARAAELLARQNAREMERQKNIAAANEIAAREAANREASQRKQAEAVAGILESMFQHLDPHGARRGDLELRSQLVAELEKIAIKSDADQSGDPLVRARLHDSLGWTLLQLGETGKALPLLQSAVNDRRSVGLHDDARSYRTLYHLGVALSALYAPEAVKPLEEAQAWQISNLGESDRETLRTSLQLGMTYREIGRYPQAISLVTRVHTRQAASLGSDDPETLQTLFQLALLEGNAGRFRDAIRLLNEVYERQVRTLSADHPDALRTQCWLAVAYDNAGRVHDAVALLAKVLDEQTQKLGPEHPDTLVTKRLLADNYAQIGRMSQAIKMQEDLEEVDARKLGPDDPEISRVTVSLINHYDRVGRVSDAVHLLERLVDQRVHRSDEKDLETLNLKTMLAHQYARAGRYPDAIRLGEAARDQMLATLGPNSPGIIPFALNLSDIYAQAGRRCDAIRLLESLANKRNQMDPPGGYDALEVLYRLAQAYRVEGRDEDAIRLLTQMQEITARNGSQRTWDEAEEELEKAYLDEGRNGEAIHLLEQARLKQLDPLLASDLRPIVLGMRLVSLYRSQGRIADATKLQEEIRQNASQVSGPDAGLTVANTNTLILLFDEAGRTADAEKLLQQSKATILRALQTDPRTIRGTRDLVGFYKKKGRSAEAVNLLEQVRQAAVQAYGADHELSRQATEDLLVLYKQLGRKTEADRLVNESIAHASERLARAGDTGREPLLRTRAELFARADRFPEAMADYREAARLAPEDHLNWHDGVVPLLLKVGDLDECRSWRSAELRKFRSASDNMVAHRIAKDAFIIPVEGEDLKIATELADRALPQGLTDWSFGYQTKGMAELRSGHDVQAVVYLIMSREISDDAIRAEDQLLMALAWQRLGNHAQALAALDLGLGEWNLSRSKVLRNPPMDYILAQAISREALALIDPARSTSASTPASIDESWVVAQRRLKGELADLPHELRGNTSFESGLLYGIRGSQYARMGEFHQACSDYAKAIDADPEIQDYWHAYMPLLLQNGQIERYRECRGKELRRFDAVTDFKVANRVAKDCLILPAEGEDLQRAVKVADRALAGARDAWNMQLKGLAEYRLGHYEQAITWASKVEQAVDYRTPGQRLVLAAMTKPLLAMAYHKSGQQQLAERALADTEELANKLSKPGEQDLTQWNFMDWILAQLLRREAEALMNANGSMTNAASTTQPDKLNAEH